MTLENKLNTILTDHNVQVKFTVEAKKDLASYDKDTQHKILALIIKRAINGPLIKPHGLGDSLSKKLSGLTKIKPKAMNLRIVYRPVEKKEIVCMEIVAIGPRDKGLVYKKTLQRLNK